MVVAIVVLALLLVGACIVIALYNGELTRWAAFLGQHPQESNTRLRTALPLPGSKKVVRAINGKLDESALRERQIREDEEDLIGGLAGLSHDIRTPLAGAKGYVQLARAEDDPQEIYRYLALAEKRMGSMQTLLDQLFDYLRAPAMVEVEEMEEQDIVPLLAAVLVGNYPIFEEKGWQCDVQLENASLYARVDKQAMKRVFENIISNTLKYGGGELVISVQNDTVEFRNNLATDSAIEAGEVFNRFYRGGDSREIPGAGLGLTIVKQLCDDMGLGVEVEVLNDRFILRLSTCIAH